MVYKFAQKDNYEYLSSGAVIKSYKGNTNFPVRLGHEILNRCITHLNKNEQINLYDPMCGSGYLLTTISLLNFEKINRIYGSDINKEVLKVAGKNLRLMTRDGIHARREELEYHLKKYKRQSYALSLEYLKVFEETVKIDLPYRLFEQDIFEDDFELPFLAEIIILDLPYNNLVTYKGSYSNHKLATRIKKFAEQGAVVAVIRNKTQKLSTDLLPYRIEKTTVGKRIVEIFKVDVG